MAVAGIYIVVHVKEGLVDSCVPFDDIDEAKKSFESCKTYFNAMDDHLQLLDGYGLLIDEAGYDDDAGYVEAMAEMEV